MSGRRYRCKTDASGGVVAMGLIVAFAVGPAHAYKCSREGGATGPSHFWTPRAIEMRVVAQDAAEVSAAEIEAAVQHGVDQWNAPDCSDFVMTVGPAASDPRARYDWAPGAANENVVVFRQRAENIALDDWLHQPTALAITTATFVRSTGEVLDADIEFNDTPFAFSACDPALPECVVRHDLKNSMTHELGHVVGLDHPDGVDVRRATMYASSEEGDLEKRDLDADDIDGLCFIYPRDAAVGACYPEFEREPPPDITVSEVGGCTQTGFSSAFVLLILVVSWRKRGRSDTKL